MRRCNISYRGLDRLLSELVGAELVFRVEDRIRPGYLLTEKGLEYLERCQEFESFVESFGIRP